MMTLKGLLGVVLAGEIKIGIGNDNGNERIRGRINGIVQGNSLREKINSIQWCQTSGGIEVIIGDQTQQLR